MIKTKKIRNRVREFLIDSELCRLGVYKDNDHGIFNECSWFALLVFSRSTREIAIF